MKEQIVRFHIQSTEKMTLDLLSDALSCMEESIREAYQENHPEYAQISPEIVGVKNGSVILDIALNFAADITSSILCGIINEKIHEKKREKPFEITASIKEKTKWTHRENLYVVNAILDEYVLKKSSRNVNELASELNKKLPHPRRSVLDKIQNTKALLSEKGIDNTLPCGELQHYSKDHKDAFEAACREKGL